jgi:hypothetical protein
VPSATGAGTEGFLAKPFGMMALLHEVARLLEQAAA